MASPEATFDSLYIVRRLETTLQGVTASEVQLFDYLAQLLAVFRGRPSSEWGYIFARTRHGAPFCTEVTEAMDDLEASGLVEAGSLSDETMTFKTTSDGEMVLNGLVDQETLMWRIPLLEASCSSSFMLPIAGLREALRAEPTIKNASGHAGPQELLAGPALELLYEQFDALRQLLGDQVTDLLVPASVWLAYLLEQSAAPELRDEPPAEVTP